MTHDVKLVVLGAVLATAGGLIGFFIQFFWGQFNQKRTVKNFLAESLRNFVEVVPGIVETYEKSGTLWNDHVNQISGIFNIYERNIEHVYLHAPAELKKEVVSLFSSINNFVSNARALNQMVSSENTQRQWAQGKIDKQVANLKECKSEAKSLLERLER